MSAAADTLFADGFESGGFGAWSSVVTAAGGTAVVQTSVVRTGSYAAQLSETTTSGSKAYVRKTLPIAQTDVTVSGDFNVEQEGASGGNVPFIRLFDGAGTRIVSLYRQNASGGSVQVGWGSTHNPTSGSLALGTWGNLTLHVIVNGTASTVQVSLNGTQVYSTSAASLGSNAAATLQIGNETAAQAFTLAADNISAQNPGSAGSPPVNTSPPTITGTPQQGQTLSANPGSWTGTAPITYGYQWQRCTNTGSNCQNIAGATNTTYTLTSTDVGNTIRINVTATNTAGTTTTPSTPTPVIRASSLVALWHMDETSGTTMYDAIAGNNGTLHGGITLGLPGFAGTAYGFNGSSGYVSVPSASSMNPGSANFSFTIHLKTTGTPPPPPDDWDLIRKGVYQTAGGEYKMEFQQSGQASCGFNGSSSYAEIIAGPAINNGAWHTITCVKTSTDIELVVDGQTFTKSATVGSIANTAAVTIGSHPGSDWYSGSLDEASISVG